MEFFAKKIFITLIVLVVCGLSVINATPSTIIWIPSVDFQPFKVVHLGIDNYFTLFKKGVGEGGMAFPTDMGLTVGILPFSSVQAEVGVDLFEPQHAPWAFNGKVGIPEGTLASWAPALAVGTCNLGTQKNVTNVNLVYGLIAKSFPVIGRLSAGYYTGNENILLDADGKKDNTGVLLSWDKQFSEISDNLWIAVDYQSGKSSLGALSYGFAWSFSKNVSVIFARDVFNNSTIPSTFTTQLDINI